MMHTFHVYSSLGIPSFIKSLVPHSVHKSNLKEIISPHPRPGSLPSLTPCGCKELLLPGVLSVGGNRREPGKDIYFGFLTSNQLQRD